MPKITYIDEGPDAPSSLPSVPVPDRRTRRRGPRFIVFFLFLSLLMGAIGAVGGLLLVTSTPLGTKLGIIKPGGTIDLGGLSKTEHIVLQESSAVEDAAQKVTPAVVSISTSKNVLDFFGRMVQEKGGGTGFVITSDGLIVTNKHVASDTSATYTVFVSDGKNYDAKVVATDPLNDLAVLKINASGLPVVELGSSTDLKIGQSVIAVGNALGEFSNSVTLGIVSAINRQIIAGDAGGGVAESLSGLIQTDAAINPGNSGGPLVNLAGQVVGINTAVAGSAQGIGFAIPIDIAKKAIESVKSTGAIVRPQIGVRYVPITLDLAQTNTLPVNYGAWVHAGSNPGEPAVVPGSPADKAGILENDIITEIEGKRINENSSLLDRLTSYNPGDTVTLTIHRGKETKSIKLTLGTLK